TLVRLGDTSDCCVNSGSVENGSYALFSTEMYERLKKYAPEFEDVAPIRAGFPYRPVVARLDVTQEAAGSVMGEFVSGNYFQTFGLRPAAGRLFSDSDDVKGAAMVAVMSYTAWKRDYAGDTSVIRSTFWIRSEEHTSELQSPCNLVCRLLLEKKKKKNKKNKINIIYKYIDR